MFKNHIIFIIIFILVLSGCTTTKHLESARDRIAELETVNEERTRRNTALEALLVSERTGNEELERIIRNKQSELDEYFVSERNRIEAERELAGRLSGIFKEGSDIIESLIKGHRIIADFLRAQGYVAEDLSGGSGSSSDPGAD